MLRLILLLLIVILLVYIILKPKQKQEILKSLNLNKYNFWSEKQSQISYELQQQKQYSKNLEKRIENIEHNLLLHERSIQEMNRLLTIVNNEQKRKASESVPNKKCQNESEGIKMSRNQKQTTTNEDSDCFYYATTPTKVAPVRFGEECLSKAKDNHCFLIKIVGKGLAEMYLSGNSDAVKKMVSNISYFFDYVEVIEKCNGIPRSVEQIKCGKLQWINNYWTLTRKIQIKIL